MAEINVTDASIYSNDSTQTSASVVIGENIFNYSGTYVGDTYVGPQSGSTVIDGLDVTVAEPSESAVSILIKDSYIHDADISDSNSKWNGVVMTGDGSVISGTTFTNNRQNNPDGYGRGMLVASSGSLWIDGSIFDSNYNTGSSVAVVYKRTTGEVNISGSTFINNSAPAVISSFAKGWLNISGSSIAPTIFVDNPTVAVGSVNSSAWVRISGVTFSGNAGGANNDMIMIIESAEDGMLYGREV